MDTVCPGFSNYKMEENITDIENSITNSLLNTDQSDPNRQNTYVLLCYLFATFLFGGAVSTVVTYTCVKHFS
jgi:hypothetical protein